MIIQVHDNPYHMKTNTSKVEGDSLDRIPTLGVAPNTIRNAIKAINETAPCKEIKHYILIHYHVTYQFFILKCQNFLRLDFALSSQVICADKDMGLKFQLYRNHRT